MPQYNMLEAKTKLSKLVEAVETGAESEIILARNGKPVARIVPIERPKRILGIADGLFGDLGEEWFKEWQAMDKDVAKMLEDRWDRQDRLMQEYEERAGKKDK